MHYIRSLNYCFVLCFIILLAGCNEGETPIEEPPADVSIAEQENSDVNAVISIKGGTTPEIRIIKEELITQNNCGGSANVENEVLRSKEITHIIEVGGEYTVNADGSVGIPGVGEVGVGSSVAAHLDYAYGSSETISHAITVGAEAGTNMHHTIEHQEIWEIGTAIVQVNGKEYEIPFSFKSSYSLELLESKNNICNEDLELSPPSENPSDSSLETPTATSTATLTPELPTNTPIPPTPEPPEEDPVVILDVNKAARSTTNSDVKVTWTTIELDTQTDSTIVRLLFENEDSEPLIVQINTDTYLGYEDGRRISPINIMPDTNQFGVMIVEIQPNTSYTAWMEFSELVDTSQKLHLYIDSPYGGAEKFPVLSNIQLEQTSLLPTNTSMVEESVDIREVNKAVRSTTNSDLKATWTTIELDTQTDSTIVRVLFENESNEPLIAQINTDTYLGYADGSRINPISIMPDTNQFGVLIVKIQPSTSYLAWMEFSELIDISQELHLYIDSPYGGAEKFPIIEGVQIS